MQPYSVLRIRGWSSLPPEATQQYFWVMSVKWEIESNLITASSRIDVVLRLSSVHVPVIESSIRDSLT